MDTRALVRLAALAAVVAGLTAVPAAQAAPAYDLVITGSIGSGYADVNVPDGVQLEYADAELTGDGSYVGFLARRRSDGVVSAGGFAAQVLTGSTQEYSFFAGQSEPVLAGRHRIFLFTEGSATVRVPATGLTRDLTVVVTHPSPVQSQLLDLGTGTGAAERTVDFGTLGERFVAVTAFAQAAGEVKACIRLENGGVRPGGCAGSTSISGLLPTASPDGMLATEVIWPQSGWDVLPATGTVSVTTFTSGQRGGLLLTADIGL